MISSRRASRIPRSAITDSGHWSENSDNISGEMSYPRYTAAARLSARVGSINVLRSAPRPFTAPSNLDVGDVDSMVSRLTRPNTSSARKSVLWSKPRKEYELNYEVTSNLKNPVLYWAKFPALQKHYPGTWRTANSDELSSIIVRLARPTVASTSRRDDCISRRLYVEDFKERLVKKDIAFKIKIKKATEQQILDKLPPLVSPEKDQPSEWEASESKDQKADVTREEPVPVPKSVTIDTVNHAD